MRDLRHENLVPFIGACVETGHIAILTQLCARGSLEDVLSNSNYRLDNMFIASLVGDLIKGMIYLHDSPILYHGNLKPSNCLVDSKWVLQLSDFGLRHFRGTFSLKIGGSLSKVEFVCIQLERTSVKSMATISTICYGKLRSSCVNLLRRHTQVPLQVWHPSSQQPLWNLRIQWLALVARRPTPFTLWAHKKEMSIHSLWSYTKLWADKVLGDAQISSQRM